MPADLLVLAGIASESLERHGLIACGRREDNVARVDFWTRDGVSYRHELHGDDLTVEAIVAACLAKAGVAALPPERRPTSPLN